MMERCYSEHRKEKAPTYIGCSVSPEWHNFQVFAVWFYENYIDGYELDKDIKIKGNKVYCPDACMFVSPADNSEKASAKEYVFLSPEGERVNIYNLSKFCRNNNLNRASMGMVNAGKHDHHKGWKKPKQ